ncbi:MAG: hypothetical protein D6696_06860 [Acidobacteria bacterium]|nr:MAG: hypothetical protein D6696_06860 [Acidobacteriota bacterium]
MKSLAPFQAPHLSRHLDGHLDGRAEKPQKCVYAHYHRSSGRALPPGQGPHRVSSGVFGPRLWTDAYLAALAAGCRRVSFDDDFARFPHLSLLRLRTREQACKHLSTCWHQ